MTAVKLWKPTWLLLFLQEISCKHTHISTHQQNSSITSSATRKYSQFSLTLVPQ